MFFKLIMLNIHRDPINGLAEDRRWGLWQAIGRHEAAGRITAEEAHKAREALRFMTRVYNPRHWR